MTQDSGTKYRILCIVSYSGNEEAAAVVKNYFFL